ncbi:hypothetical protein HY493_02255 [Candidatus Woesearchaeota archaeon]|nr:hypothetical protein [Candidatus Woesearchaeota archaeon]
MRRAQIKMFETLAVLVVFFFFLIFGASFYFRLQESSLEREFDRNTQLRAVQIAQKSITMPELECSFAGVQRENCMDVLKVQAFAELLATEEAFIDYFPVFQYSTLTVRQVYPSQLEWVVYNRPRGEQSTLLQIPVLIYDPNTNRHQFGYLEVRVYA